MRDTAYATELATASIAFEGGDEGKVERIHVKENAQDEIRFSWWKDGRMIPRPLDLNEEDLIRLLQNAVAVGVFTSNFRARLRDIL